METKLGIRIPAGERRLFNADCRREKKNQSQLFLLMYKFWKKHKDDI